MSCLIAPISYLYHILNKHDRKFCRFANKKFFIFVFGVVGLIFASSVNFSFSLNYVN